MFENGMEYIRADFHLHTRKDKEFKYSGEDTEFIKNYVQGLVEANIGIGVITNHNKFDVDEYKAIKKAARKENILILPGVELSVKEGANGIHTLIVFNPEDWLNGEDNHILTFLTAAFAGISNPENRNTRCKYDLGNMFERLEGYGKDYFVIFAHIDQDNGLFKECKGGLLQSLSEITSFRNRVIGLQKSRTYSNLDKFKESFKYVPALVEGSDPKSIPEIGKGEKATFLKIGELTYATVKFALINHNNRLVENRPTYNHGFIDSISFQGGKFDGQAIRFSSSLNALIGIRGSGKSAVLESVRYILGLEAQADNAYKTELIKNIWGSGGKAILSIYDKHGRKYEVSKILNEHHVVIDENGNALNLNPISLLDGVQYFGQKDLSSSADQENKLLSKFVVASRNHDSFDKHIDELITMYEHMTKLKQVPIKISDLEEEISELNHKLSIYKDKGVENKLKKQNEFITDKAKISSVKSEIEKAFSNIKKGFEQSQHISTDISEYKSEYNDEIIKKVAIIVAKINMELDNIKVSIEKISQSKKEIDDLLESFEAVRKSLADEFAAIKREISDSKIDIEAFGTIKQEFLKKSDKLKSTRDLLSQERTVKELFLNAVRKRNEDLNSVFKQYQNKAHSINEAQNELHIEVEFKGDKDSFKEKLKTDFRGTGISELKYAAISSKFSDYVDIITDIFIDDGELLRKIIPDGEYSRFCKKIDENYKDLIKYIVPDKVRIFYHSKLLREHSLGQRASALILFILTQNNNDIIIIDQPEDDLDNKVIYDEVISTIAKAKKNVQFIFATHNANIPVLGDAETVLVVDFKNEKIEVSQGNIDKLDTQKQIIDIMEGGKEAFEKRKLIYTSWKS